MKSVSALVTIGIVLLVSVGGIGCLSQIMQKGAGSKKLLDFATAENGATVIASMATPGHEVRAIIDSTHDYVESVLTSMATPGHDAESTINGITSSGYWDKGEGWEVQFERLHADQIFLNPFDDQIPGKHAGVLGLKCIFRNQNGSIAL